MRLLLGGLAELAVQVPRHKCIQAGFHSDAVDILCRAVIVRFYCTYELPGDLIEMQIFLKPGFAYFKIFIYLAVSGLSRGTQDLLLWHMGSLVWGIQAL